jgi:hypothetical protein
MDLFDQAFDYALHEYVTCPYFRSRKNTTTFFRSISGLSWDGEHLSYDANDKLSTATDGICSSVGDPTWPTEADWRALKEWFAYRLLIIRQFTNDPLSIPALFVEVRRIRQNANRRF